jgi:tRNA nucleotidyltransferase (CCA-adding enzyme)
MIEKRWEHFGHGADIGVRGIGASKEEAFEQAAMALTGVITDPAIISPEQEVTIECQAPDDELLLADWLNALIYEMATRKMLFSRFQVHLDGHRLRAVAFGEQLDAAKHQPAVEVKGATFTGLSVKKNESGAWVAECVVDV